MVRLHNVILDFKYFNTFFPVIILLKKKKFGFNGKNDGSRPPP